MFYSHEILTNRQYGVATIWLVATLGSKSNLKKITRRAILDVDLQKACRTITEPEVPLALRLQGSLLFGVSRVFQQQCGYVLTDVTSLRDNMRSRAPVLQEMELDLNVGNTRPEQLNLAEDPYFFPDLDLNFDLSAFRYYSEASSPLRSGSSPFSLPSSQTSLHVGEEAEEIGLVIPSTSTPAGGIGGFDIPLAAGTSSVARTGGRVDRLPSVFDQEAAIIDDPVFDVDDDGFLRPAMSGDLLGESQPPSVEGQPLASEVEAIDRAAREPPPTAGEDESMLNLDDDMIIFGDDIPVFPLVAPQIPLTPEPDGEDVQNGRQPTSSVQPTEESSETAEAPQRRTRTAKAIQPDRQTELNNRDLNEWNQNYLANMAVASRIRENHAAHSEAKKNAEFWVLQQGLGNVASSFGYERAPHPLAIFTGQSLWEMLRGPERGTKRSRISSLADEPEGEEERRVRARTTSHEGVARGEGEGFQFADDDGLILQGDDFDIEAEVGRHAPPSLPDHSSGMPWNKSGSRQSSVLHPGSGLGLVPRLSSSVGGLPGCMELGPPSALSRRGSRLTSASPLFGRGPSSLSGHSSQGPLDPSRLTSNEDEFADLDAQLGAGLDLDFELYGPSATVDTQTAAQSQWVAAALENEAYNFLTFVNTKIQEKAEQQEGAMEEGEGAIREQTIMFDELLPPMQNSAIVGAQALIHVLALTTKGLLEVYQAEHFGNIKISVASH